MPKSDRLLAHNYPHVLSTDISDFYPRVYHHRVENALSHATKNRAAVSRCKKLLSLLAVGGVSYGLPIGGNAARLLAELVLNRTDRLLSPDFRFRCGTVPPGPVAAP